MGATLPLFFCSVELLHTAWTYVLIISINKVICVISILRTYRSLYLFSPTGVDQQLVYSSGNQYRKYAPINIAKHKTSVCKSCKKNNIREIEKDKTWRQTESLLG